MSGEEFYLFSRTLVITQKIDLDPLFFVPASRVVWGLNAIITFDAQTMQVAFEEVGVAQEFTPQTRGAGELEWDTRSVLLPDQGFVIVMATTPRATHVEGRPDT